ncbi:MAG: PDZ domain-containing protein [Thermoanaerobaculia bacterium]|nr:PDZ domain-containing protein [Thermoanaerobaculia bacterium]
MGIGGPGAAASDAPGGGTLIERVVPGKPMEQAGVRAGDIVVAVDGQAIRNGHDWGEMAWQFEPEKPFVLTVERDGQPMQLTLLFPHRPVWEMRNRTQWLDYGLSAALALLYVAMGLVALFARPRDPGAVAGAVLLLMFGGFLGPGSGAGTAAMFRQWPFLLQVPAFVIDTLLGGYLVLVFAALYPRPVFRRRWILPVLLVPALLVITYNAVRFYHRFYMPEQAISPGPPWASQLQVAVESANILAGLIILALGYWRLKDTQTRRSLRRVLLGTLISFGAVVFYLMLLASGAPALQRIYESRATGFVLLVLWSVFPVVFAQAVLRTGSQPASTIAD